MKKQLNYERNESQLLKIGFVFDDSLDKHGGVGQYVKEVGKWLTAQGHEVRYLVGKTMIKDWAGGKVYSLSQNVSVDFNGNRLSMPLFSNRKRIKEVLSHEKFDILHIQVPYSPFMAQRVISSADANTAVIGTVHIVPAGWASAWGSKLLGYIYGRSLGRFDHMFAVSPAAANYAKWAFNIETEVSSNVVDLSAFRQKKLTKDNSADLKIIFLGRLVKRKGCMQLLEAFSILHSRLPDVRLVIAGGGPDRPKLERFVALHNLKDRVSFLGPIDEKSKQELFADANIACFPALYGESFGIVLIEAMAAGAGVVIGGANPGYRSVLGKRPETLVDANQIDDFAAKLESLLRDKNLSQDLHQWQQKHVQQFDVSVVGPKIEAIYREAVAKRVQKSHN